MQSRPQKLTRWFIFSVLVSLAPLVTSWLAMRLDRKPGSLQMVTARGELLLISTTIAAATVGEVIAGGRDRATQKLVAGGSCILSVLLSSLFFATIQARSNPDPASVLATSMVLFIGTLLASCSCVYLAAEGEPA